MATIQTNVKPIHNLYDTEYNYNEQINMDTELEKSFDANIYAALQEAMTIKTDDMEVADFKNLVLFILNVKCGTI